MGSESAPNELFVGLVLGLRATAWMQLGKIMHPATGKVERDLAQAKETIDLLGMLDEKSRGNQHPEETRLLTQVLYELRMNYVDELKASVAASAQAPAAEQAPAEPQAPATSDAGTQGEAGRGDS